MTEAGLDCIAIQSLGHDKALGRGAGRAVERAGCAVGRAGRAGRRWGMGAGALGRQARVRAGVWT